MKPQTIKVLAIVLCVVMLVTLPTAISNHILVLWSVTTIGIAVGLYAELKASKRLKRATWGIIGIFCLLAFAACAPYYTADPGPGIPPHVVGMEWAQTPSDNYDCAIGIMADGSIALANLLNPPIGLGVDWLAYGVIGFDGPPGISLVDCYHMAQQNWSTAFNLYIQCYGQPVLRTTWTDFGAASAWVQIPFCQCNIACKGFSNVITSFWRSHIVYCSFNKFVDSRCYGGIAVPNTANVADTTTTTTDQTGNIYDCSNAEPLPPDYGSLGWNTSDPVPEHVINSSSCVA